MKLINNVKDVSFSTLVPSVYVLFCMRHFPRCQCLYAGKLDRRSPIYLAEFGKFTTFQWKNTIFNEQPEVRIYKRKQESKNKRKKVFFFFSLSLSLSRACFLSFFLVFPIAFLVEFLFSYFFAFFYKFPPQDTLSAPRSDRRSTNNQLL